MKYLLIACKAIKPEIEFCMARCLHTIDILWMEQGLHNTPDKLRAELGDKLRSIDGSYDAVLLGYGLCGNGILGLSCSLPLVVPRAHDCITLLLGSKQRHEEYSRLHPGCYFFSAGWIDHSRMPGRQRDLELYEEYTAKYGPDNADYLMEVEQSWKKQYKKAVFIDWNLPGKERYIQFTRESADYLGWDFEQIDGDPALLQRFLDGRWNPDEITVLPPGEPVTQDLIGPCTLELQP
jgi:hypothetical protein